MNVNDNADDDEDGNEMGKVDTDKLQYEDPMVSELKQTEVRILLNLRSFDGNCDQFSVSQRHVQTG